MDILLTHGYFLNEDEHEKKVMRPYPPLGILSISAYLKQKGFDVAVYDTTFRTPDDFRAYITQMRPAIIGVYANMMTRRFIIRLLPAMKAVGATVIMGGPDPANYPQNYLDYGADVVVIGEGEATLEELIPHITKHGVRDMAHIHGLVYRQDADLIRTPERAQIADLNTLPMPDRGAIDIPQYIETWRAHHGKGAVSLITARGCPYKCNWCSHAVYGYTHRRRSPQVVADEVAHIKATYNPELLWYADDVFTINHRWLFAYAQELGQRGLHTPFETISREDRLNEKVVQTLAEMGCYRLWVGAESGSQRILDAMERQTDVKRVIEMVHLLKRYNIQTGMFIMLGYEGEELSDLQATVQTLKEANPDIFLTTVAYPIAGTKFHAKVADRVVSTKDWADGSDSHHTVLGRHSRAYYAHATRWMVGEVAYHQQKVAPKRDIRRMGKAYLNAKLGRVGMWLTRHQVETGV
ncbi:MAG: B12-binding domain-containing radical SAM protein [Phototrophicales bacterium]|nr:MAG: B12-binding domain-containing radical SAM protein [Phototrophicales bacterium]